MGTYTLGIVGESHYQDAIRRCRQGDRVILKREPENPYDENAVAVLREDGETIGYLARDHAVWVAERMDEGRQVEAKIKLLTGGTRDKPTRGVIIDVDTTPLRTEKLQAETGGFWKSLFGRRSSKIEGPIGYFGLAEWWVATFTDAERKYIDRGGSLTEGHISHTSGTAASSLSALATNFYKPEERRIAWLMLEKAEELAKAAGNILDLHFVYQGMIETSYADRDNGPEALDLAIAACEKQIALGSEAAKAWTLENPKEPLPAHKGYTQLTIIREKQKNFADAVSLSRLAMKQGWTGDWEQRIARNERRLAKP